MGREPIEIDVVETPLEAVDADVLAVRVPEGGPLDGPAETIDARLGGRLAQLLDDGELRGKLGETVVVHLSGEIAARRIAGVGVGPTASIDADALRTAAARLAARSAGMGGGTVVWALTESLPVSAVDQVRALVEGTVLGSYDAGAWKTSDARPAPVQRLVLVARDAAPLLEPARRAGIVAAWTERCRDLGNTPANELTPVRLAEHAATIARETDVVGFSALGREQIVAAGMGAFAAVAQGSHAEPQLIGLDYAPPGARDDLVLGLVGKAITFDTGGISLKPSARMDDMKMDMAGGAAAICGLGAVATLGIPLRVLALVPAAENMPSGHATRPGDIVTALNGKTIEITNTDAEGRLVLADALVEARRRGATHLLDLATLTGAVVVALGDFYAGLMGNDDAWIAEILAAAQESGDHAWRLPLHDTYRRYIESSYADLKNASELRQAGPVYAGRFLQEFAGDGPWAHLDIAGTADLERGRGDYLTTKGATGYGVRLIVALAERLAR